jgi:Sec-independent protein secretion pathway component TatC
MNPGKKTTGLEDMRAKLSTLWVVVMFNMVFADILTFIKPGALQELWAGQAGVEITSGVLLAFAILLEVPIAMIFLSRVLKPAPGRWANTVAAVTTAAFVVGGGSLTPHYVFFATIEVACLGLIVWSVWSRRDHEADRPGALRSRVVRETSSRTQ